MMKQKRTLKSLIRLVFIVSVGCFGHSGLLQGDVVINLIDTNLSLNVSKNSLQTVNERLDVVGELTLLGDPEISQEELQIELIITAPDGSQRVEIAQTARCGLIQNEEFFFIIPCPEKRQYQFLDLGEFNLQGDYFLQAQFRGTNSLDSSNSLIEILSTSTSIQLLTPEVGETNLFTTLVLDWESFVPADSDNVLVEYNLIISENSDFSTEVIRKEGLSDSSFLVIGEDANELNSNTTYFWQVEAVNALQGDILTVSFNGQYQPLIGMFPGGVIQGLVQSNIDQALISGASVVNSLNSFDDGSIPFTSSDGQYTILVKEEGTTTVTSTASGFEDLSISGIEVISEQITPLNLRMTPTTVNSAGELANLSTRGFVGSGAQELIAGLIVEDQPIEVLIRVRGPSLTNFGLSGVINDPTLDLFSGQTSIAFNDNFQNSADHSAIIATGLAPPDAAREPAILIRLNPGAYTAIVRGVNNMQGVGIVEVFRLPSSSGRLANLSTRGVVGSGNEEMIAGFIIEEAPANILLRVRGPSLADFGLTGEQNPSLQLFNSNSIPVTFNDDFQTSAKLPEINASGFATVNGVSLHPLEPVIFENLAPGAYTAIVNGLGNTGGLGVVEVFTVP